MSEQKTDHIIRVLIPKQGLFPLDYAVKSSIFQSLSIGTIILVPFRNKIVTAIVWQLDCERNPNKKLRNIIEETHFPCFISQNMILLIERTANYYLTELGDIAKLVLPVDINETPIKQLEQTIPTNITLARLNSEQEAALETLEQGKKPIIIQGVTGSGKTEIYFHAVLNQIKEGKQALIMLPEIALSTQIIARFKQRFGFEPAIWNSKITKARKKRILRGIISGEVKIVIGARSSLFLPYKNLGIIIVDEEHDSSYKQNEGILYNARDMAVLRGHIEGSKVALISATPSIESLYNAKKGKYNIARLHTRFSQASMPNVEIINMQQETLDRNKWVSSVAIKKIHQNLEKKQQVLIFLNRRGYAPLMLCKACGYRFTCSMCSASLVMHKKYDKMECHHCGSSCKTPTKCPDCSESDGLILCGPGIERIYEEINEYFPEARSEMISKEQSANNDEMQAILSSMEHGDIDILIGTQIVTKGYHFPNLTLVIVVDSDIGFMGGDLRASEKNFQLLHQVGGRAGRDNKKGEVLIQTYYPDHKVITALSEGREDDFIIEELSSRQEANMPPFSKMAIITITGKNQQKTLQIAKDFSALAPVVNSKDSIKIMGPAEAMMLRLAGKYRYKILIIAKRDFNLQAYLRFWKESVSIPSSFYLKFDIDPQIVN